MSCSVCVLCKSLEQYNMCFNLALSNDNEVLACLKDVVTQTRHYPKPVVNGWGMRRYQKLDVDILIQSSFITDDELNSALSSSFVSSTGVRVLTVEMVLTLENTYIHVI